MKNKLWLLFILITVVTWGIWGAFSGYQISHVKGLLLTGTANPAFKSL